MLNQLRLWLIAAMIAVTAITAPVAIAAQSAPTEGASLSGIAYRLSNNAGKEAIISQHKGATAPSYATAGLIWLDDTATPWLLKQYDGVDWITLGSVNATTNAFTPYYGAAPLRLLNYAVDTGGANVYAVAPSPAISAYAVGQIVTLKPSHNNTGASTINVNGAGIKAIKNVDGYDLASGTLNSNGFYLLVYDGTNFVLAGGGGVTEAGITLSDVTTNNASTSKHGFLKKLNNDASTYMDGAGNWSAPPSASNVIVNIFTADGTYNTPPGTKWLEVELVGGGGGGGASALAAGGGGGGVVKGIITSPLSSYAVVVGQGGAAGTTAGGSGGGFSRFGSVLGAGGGGGGYARNNSYGGGGGGGGSTAVAGSAAVNPNGGAGGGIGAGAGGPGSGNNAGGDGYPGVGSTGGTGIFPLLANSTIYRVGRGGVSGGSLYNSTNTGAGGNPGEAGKDGYVLVKAYQ